VTTTGKSQWLDENKVVSPKKFASFSLSLKKMRRMWGDKGIPVRRVT
jgi:hypothetical protein